MKHKIKPLEDYLKTKAINEEFTNPFDVDNTIETKPSHISDKGGMLKLRKEVLILIVLNILRKEMDLIVY